MTAPKIPAIIPKIPPAIPSQMGNVKINSRTRRTVVVELELLDCICVQRLLAYTKNYAINAKGLGVIPNGLRRLSACFHC